MCGKKTRKKKNCEWRSSSDTSLFYINTMYDLHTRGKSEVICSRGPYNPIYGPVSCDKDLWDMDKGGAVKKRNSTVYNLQPIFY